ncbi:hypothetical protein [Actinomycetospora aeridis]|uniref:Right handed beta helix domain-containing protein n=1 Tax=Actinomycetospora aeridis TaxID=3129231 RepID=A0ABU8ND22_9PSEU
MATHRTRRPTGRLIAAGALVVGVGAAAGALVPALAAPGAATYTVTTVADAGPGSLRQAITDANDSGGTDRIEFAIPGAGPRTIAVDSPLPEITDPVTVDGYTQPGATPNTRSAGSDAELGVEIAGGDDVAGNGLTLADGSGGSTVRGLVVNGFTGTVATGNGAGVKVESDGNTIAGNVLGLDADGETAAPNRTAGVLVTGQGNTVGGGAAADRNVVSGNGNRLNLQSPVPVGTAGVYLRGGGARANTVDNNIIGPSASGDPVLTRGSTGPSLVQGNGVIVEAGAQRNVIGATERDDPGNVISGNATRGVWIQLPGTSYNSVSGNRIGTDLEGDGPLPGPTDPAAVQDSGIQISQDARYDSIGVGPDRSTEPGFGNEIAYNDNDGVVIGGTQRLATDFTDGHLIRFNTYHDNGGSDDIGIAINGDSGTPEQGLASPFERTPGLGNAPHDRNVTNLDEPTDFDTGPNNENNLVRLDPTTSLEGGRAHARGTVNTEPNATFVIDFYANDDPDPSGYGEGEHFVGSSTIDTDALGNATIDVLLPADENVTSGSAITASTTKISGGVTSVLPADAGELAGQLTQPPFSTGEFGKNSEVE